MKIAQRFNAGCLQANEVSPVRDERNRVFCETPLSPLRGYCFLNTRNPRLKPWAIIGLSLRDRLLSNFRMALRLLVRFPGLPRLLISCSIGLLSGCSRAPTFDIVGSFFPAWLVCLIAGIFLASFAHWLLSRLKITLLVPILVYPSLAALFTFLLWLAFFS